MVNHKRVYRIYREAGLCLRRKKRKHCIRASAPLRQYTAADQEWALDFAHDALAAGRKMRVPIVIRQELLTAKDSSPQTRRSLIR